MLYITLPRNVTLDVHIKNPKPMKYVPAQLSSFLRCNKIEKCLFRLSGLFGLTELNSALLAAFLFLFALLILRLYWTS